MWIHFDIKDRSSSALWNTKRRKPTARTLSFQRQMMSLPLNKQIHRVQYQTVVLTLFLGSARTPGAGERGCMADVGSTEVTPAASHVQNNEASHLGSRNLRTPDCIKMTAR